MNQKTKHAGADWLIDARGVELSRLGATVADLLGDLYAGLYHLEDRALERTNWSDPYMIEVVLRDGGRFATFDFDYLTRFVFLCHAACVRGEISGRSNGYLALRFHQRQREGTICKRHPPLDLAVEEFERSRGKAPIGDLARAVRQSQRDYFRAERGSEEKQKLLGQARVAERELDRRLGL